MKKIFVVAAAAVMLLVNPIGAQAGFIYDFSTGSSAAIIDALFLGVGVAPDNVSDSSLADLIGNEGQTNYNWILIQKAFFNLDPIDISFSVSNTGTVEEYLIAEVIGNGSVYDWSDYHLELGVGLGENFHSLESLGATGLGLDFDTPDQDPAPEFVFLSSGTDVFSALGHNPGSLNWASGAFPIGESAILAYALDVPDAGVEPGYAFTLRQYPTIPGSPVIPEPATMLLIGSGLAGAFLRKKRFC